MKKVLYTFVQLLFCFYQLTLHVLKGYDTRLVSEMVIFALSQGKCVAKPEGVDDLFDVLWTFVFHVFSVL